MFNVTSTPEFTHTVRVQTPIDGDAFREDTFQTRFRLIDDDDASVVNLNDPEAIKESLRRRIVWMGDLADEQRNEIEYTEAVREMMLAKTHVRIALLHAYGAAITKSRLGN